MSREWQELEAQNQRLSEARVVRLRITGLQKIEQEAAGLQAQLQSAQSTVESRLGGNPSALLTQTQELVFQHQKSIAQAEGRD